MPKTRHYYYAAQDAQDTITKLVKENARLEAALKDAAMKCHDHDGCEARDVCLKALGKT